MADGVLKAEKDYTKEADTQVPQAQELAKSNVHGAIEKLLVLEKQARQASDLPTTSRVLVAMVTICKEAGDWGLLDEQVLLLSKKHGQLKQATTRMVQVVMAFLDDAPTLEVKLAAIETLRTVTEGKIFVEVERARVTRILSEIKKSQGDIKAAADILCELQVETFGSMSRREKTEFILEQVALCIENGDWVQAGILARKISTRYFARKPAPAAAKARDPNPKEETPKQEEKPEKPAQDAAATTTTTAPDDDPTDLKLRYYEQQITLAKHEERYLDACKHYRAVLDTERVENNADELRACLERVIYFIVLAPYDHEQADLQARIERDGRNGQVAAAAALLKRFTRAELMRWPVVAAEFGPALCATDVFAADAADAGGKDAKAGARWADLRKRVIEHNVRVVARYYTRVDMGRLQALLDLGEDETERYISDLVTAKTIYAKIDRPARIVSFARPRDADDVLNEWSGNMKSLLGLLERIDHLITKEEMMNNLQPKSAKVH